MAMAAVARRRRLLNDDVIISLADTSWELLDISGSDVSDFCLGKVVEICKSLRAVDISRCDKITITGFSELVQNCHSLETLRCGKKLIKILWRFCPLNVHALLQIPSHPSPFGFRGSATVSSSLSSPSELSDAENFGLAFVERDTRLAPKRAKNARQNQRRAVRE
ncbi:protein AMN1 homolog [Fagus crenata]